MKAGIVPAFLLAWGLLNPVSVAAQPLTFDYDRACQKAHRALLNYDTDSARYYLAQSPGNNLVTTYLSNYFDFFRLLSYESKAAYDSLLEKQDARLDRLKKGPESSPFHRFTRAEVYLQWAVVKAKFGDYWAAGWDFNKAYRLLKNNQQAHPDFLPNQKSLLPIQALIGALPDQYQWIAGLLGFEGALEETGEAYASVFNDYCENPEFKAFCKETGFIKGLMQYHLLNQPGEAWETIRFVTEDYKRNPLSAFFRASMAMRTKQSQALRETLAPYKAKTPAIPHLDYLAGNVRLYRLDPGASRYFGRYIRNFKGHSYVKDAYLKIAWAYLLKGDQEQCENVAYLAKHKGKAVRGEDRQALREIGHYDKANLHLLKARLRFDGGYYKKGLRWLNQQPAQTQQPAGVRMEYHYRKARIHQKLEEAEKALKHYEQVLALNEAGFEAYYKPAAHLYSGKILEAIGEMAKAEGSYSQVLEFSGYPYERSFSQKAKAGLKRLEGG